MRTTIKIAALVLVLTTAFAATRKRDPLTYAEAEQLREVALEPHKRLLLLIKFTDARLTSLAELRADPKQAEGRGKRIHDLLEDFTSILDEINDNLDQYEGRPLSKDDRKDFHKGLKAVIEACSGWDLKLKALRSDIKTDAQTKQESADFRFVLQDAEDALKSTGDVAREYMENKKDDEKPAKDK